MRGCRSCALLSGSLLYRPPWKARGSGGAEGVAVAAAVPSRARCPCWSTSDGRTMAGALCCAPSFAAGATCGLPSHASRAQKLGAASADWLLAPVSALGDALLPLAVCSAERHVASGRGRLIHPCGSPGLKRAATSAGASLAAVFPSLSLCPTLPACKCCHRFTHLFVQCRLIESRICFNAGKNTAMLDTSSASRVRVGTPWRVALRKSHLRLHEHQGGH